MYTGCETEHVCEPIYCHTCEAHFMAWLEQESRDLALSDGQTWDNLPRAAREHYRELALQGDETMSATDERTPEYERMLHEERLIFDASELVYEMMELRGVNKAELARRTGTTRGFITQVLSGSRNMTLRTLADFAHVLGFRITLGARLGATTGDER